MVFLFVMIGAQPLQAQDTERKNQNTIGNIDFSSDFSGNYFVDEAGLQLALTSTPLDEFINPDTYILGPYDVLSIYGREILELNYRGLIVNASGSVVIPGIGSVAVNGLTLTEATDKIKETFSTELKQSKISVSIDRPRPVVVHIGGDIPNPGRYVLPAGTRFNALVSGFPIEDRVIFPLVNQPDQITTQINSSRPSVTGIDFDKLAQQQDEKDEDFESFFNKAIDKYDMRLLEVTSVDSSVRYIDLGAYYNSGKRKFNPYISDGDQVTVVRRNKNRSNISISGAILTPFKGTYRNDDTFEKLFEVAGGFDAEADTTKYFIYRISNGTTQKLTFEYGTNVDLMPNDRVVIPYTEQTSNVGTASIAGQVNSPGIYNIVEGETTLADLLAIAGGLNNRALPTAAYLVRETLDNRGVTSVTSFNPSLLTRSSDQYLEGYDYMALERALNPSRMAINFNDSELINSVTLLDGDNIYIPKDEYSVTLMGQVNQPGFYSYKAEMNISDYIDKAGGYTVAANKERVFVIKAGSRAWKKPGETRLNSGDIIFVDRNPFEDFTNGRNLDLRAEERKDNRVRLILTTISTVATVVTTYLAVRNFSRN